MSSSFSPAALASVTGLVLFGTTTSLLAKIVYELQGPSLEDHERLKLFRKPWAMTTVMFVGMSFCLPLAHFQEWRAHSEERQRKKQLQRQRQQQSPSSVRAPLLEPVQEGSEAVYNGNGDIGHGAVDSDGTTATATSRFRAAAAAELRRAALLSVPTAFDLVATVLMNVGLLSVTASVYQMMRGAEMLFAALFAVVFLRRRLNRWHFGGIACCVAGIGLVGAASVFSGEGSQTRAVSKGEMLLGMSLIVASQAVQAAQVTFEDHFMSDSGLGIAPLMIVGYEGVIGAALMLGVMLPFVAKLPGNDGDGVHEDSADTWHMITHSPSIATTLAVDMTALMLYNVAGMAVTGHLGAVFRTVLETGRTLFVWIVDLLLFYCGVAGGKLGESWSAWSWLQAGGFVVLVVGTLVYGRGDEAEAVEAAAAAAAAAATSAAGADGELGEVDVQGEAQQQGQFVSPTAEQLLPSASPASAGPFASAATAAAAAVPMAMSARRRTPAATPTAPIAVTGTPLSFKSTMNINHFSSSYIGAGSLSGSLQQQQSWSRTGGTLSPSQRPTQQRPGGV